MSEAVAHSLRIVATVIALPLLGSMASAAPTSAQQSAIKSSCQSDYRANCASVPPGGSAALQCLQQNLGKLSPSCQQAVTAASGGAAPAPTAANPPPPPPGATPGAPPPPKAPTSAAKAPPPPPPPVQMSPRQEAMLVRQYCRADFARYCSTVRLGAGNGAACLRANAARLSRGCQQALAAAMR
ncbi:hypothetical protein SAMN02745157_1355 [Kaistia soli DSM 19436]|uniref:Cysteine rich repeat-containing protein n=1 Tax=Kaistia soli DSM 19436 TaxID=1122133 RepID=A0A1M4XVV2_9HYPH|nr:hypothetical protein [Kaistia soli]SHE97609.1 hypothetical protein SAMN02745157_1355 [Kaistia soli DSM 19436]